MNRDSGIYLSKRTVYITILVSLCLNAFFLMMGILIGKDDSKWDQQKANKQPAPSIETPLEKDELDSELAIFQPEDEYQPPEPLDLSQTQAQKVEPEKPTTVAAKPDSGTKKPEQKAQKPTATTPPTEKKPTPSPSRGLSPGYWVQVLAIDNPEKAESFKQKVARLGYPTTVVKEKQFYKVLVGPHSNRKDASTASTQINQRFKLKTWIRKI